MADWFYGKDDTQHGPTSEVEIRNILSKGEIDTSTIIWREGMTDWLPLKDVPEFQVSAQALPRDQPHTSTAPTESFAIISMVLGIISIIASCMYIGILFGIPATIFGHLSIKKIHNSPIPMDGRGLAIAGLIMGYLGIIISLCIIGSVAALFLFST